MVEPIYNRTFGFGCATHFNPAITFSHRSEMKTSRRYEIVLQKNCEIKKSAREIHLLKSKISDQLKKNLKKTPREIQSYKLKMCDHHKKIGNKKKINKKL